MFVASQSVETVAFLGCFSSSGSHMINSAFTSLTIFGNLFYASARSRVRGYLELYHAYILDENSSNNDGEESRGSEVEPGWELLDQNGLSSSGQVSPIYYSSIPDSRHLCGCVGQSWQKRKGLLRAKVA